MGRRQILFIHDRFPGQFGDLALHLQMQGWDVTFATRIAPQYPPPFRVVIYTPHREPAPQTHPYAQPMERAALTGQAFARTAISLHKEGVRPDVILAHSGWGAALYARDIFPQAKLVAYAEWWYGYPATDMAFLAALDSRFQVTRSDLSLIERSRNAPLALDLATADARLCPTSFQAAQFPPLIRTGLTIGHEGVDTDFFSPGPVADPSLGGRVPPEARLITYATRGMEPHRGFPHFMAALPEVLAAHPDTFAVIAGENRVCYGSGSIRDVDWKAEAMRDFGRDAGRVIFTGPLAKPVYRDLLRLSSAHVYLTVPFVLSWSMIEAMAVAPPLVMSDTDPVREFAGPDEAILTDFDPAAISVALSGALARPHSPWSSASREKVITTLSYKKTLPQREQMLAAFVAN